LRVSEITRPILKADISRINQAQTEHWIMGEKRQLKHGRLCASTSTCKMLLNKTTRENEVTHSQRKALNLFDCLENVGASTSHNPMDPHGLLQGQLHLFNFD
jgi:hypothetical protein